MLAARKPTGRSASGQGTLAARRRATSSVQRKAAVDTNECAGRGRERGPFYEAGEQRSLLGDERANPTQTIWRAHLIAECIVSI